MIRSYSPEWTHFVSSWTRRTGKSWVSRSSTKKRERRSQPESHSSYSAAWARKASRSSLREAAPPAMTMSVRLVTSGSRFTSVAARSQLSSVARYHSRRAVWSARSGSMVMPTRGMLSRSRSWSAVMYMTWSERMWPASCASTVWSSSSSSSETVEDARTTIGFFEPIVLAFASGHCVT